MIWILQSSLVTFLPNRIITCIVRILGRDWRQRSLKDIFELEEVGTFRHMRVTHFRKILHVKWVKLMCTGSIMKCPKTHVKYIYISRNGICIFWNARKSKNFIFGSLPVLSLKTFKIVFDHDVQSELMCFTTKFILIYEFI